MMGEMRQMTLAEIVKRLRELPDCWEAQGGGFKPILRLHAIADAIDAERKRLEGERVSPPAVEEREEDAPAKKETKKETADRWGRVPGIFGIFGIGRKSAEGGAARRGRVERLKG